MFIGFDACVGAAEETQDAARHVPRAIWIALLSVGALVILNAVAVDARPSRPGGGRRRRGHRPGDHRGGHLVRLVVGQAVRRGRAGRVPGLRDGGAGAHRAHDLLGRPRRRAARVARSCAGSTGAGRRSARSWSRPSSPASGCCSAWTRPPSGSLIAFGTAAIYVAFLLIALAALIARLRGTWRRRARPARPRGLVVNALAVAWLAFETVNIAWPRESLAPPGAPFYQVWAAPLVLAVIAVAGLAYLVIARPHDAPA